MAITNHDRVGKALELLTTGLKPFIERELKSSWGDKFLENTKTLLSDTRLQARGGGWLADERCGGAARHHGPGVEDDFQPDAREGGAQHGE
jgi:hypothetical protein